MFTTLPDVKIEGSMADGPRYADSVGTGFSGVVVAALRERLDRIKAERCPIAGLKVGGAVWVSPDLRAEIPYSASPEAASCGMQASRGSRGSRQTTILGRERNGCFGARQLRLRTFFHSAAKAISTGPLLRVRLWRKNVSLSR